MKSGLSFFLNIFTPAMKTKNLSPFIAALLFTACVDTQGKLVQEEKTASEEKTEKQELQSGQTGAVKESVPDVIRYTLTTPDLGTWGNCLGLSSWAEVVRKGEYTFLCPTDASLLQNERRLVTEFNKPQNKKLLDAVMARHLIKGQFRYADLSNLSEVETISGERLRVDGVNHTIGGVTFRDRVVLSETLYLIEVSDLLAYPEVELKDSAGKK